MDAYQRGLLLLVAVGLTALSGASCPQMLQQYQPPPRVLSASPSLEEVIQVVNRNNSQIDSFTTTHATLSGQGFPTLRANVAFQRPNRFRLRADLLSSPEMDLGSNEQGFWFWVKRSQPAALFYCRHEQFATSAARQMTPIEPEWLIEAVGVGVLDPALPHQGPVQLPGDRLEIRTVCETPQGPATQVTIVDGGQGWILEKRLHDAQGRLLASSVAGRHRRDPLSGLVMATVVQVNCPGARLAMRIDLGSVQINRLSPNQTELWSVPNYPGYPLVDMGDPNFQVPQGPAQQAPPPPSMPRAQYRAQPAGPPVR